MYLNGIRCLVTGQLKLFFVYCLEFEVASQSPVRVKGRLIRIRLTFYGRRIASKIFSSWQFSITVIMVNPRNRDGMESMDPATPITISNLGEIIKPS